MTQLSTELNNGYVVLFHDGSKMDISKQQADFLMEQSCKKDLKGCVVNESFITFSSISKILSIQDYYEQYPDKRPADNYNQFEDTYGSGGSEQIRKPTEKAKELMKEGFISYHLGNGKTPEEAEKKFEDLMKDGVDYKIGKLAKYRV